MERVVYGVLSRVASVILVIVGVLAIWGGLYAHGYVRDQLAQERITMPADAALTTPEMKSALGKWSGTQLDSGPKAKAFANNYILEHMNAASGNKTYSEVSADYMKLAKDPAADPAAVTKAADLRQSTFMGDTLRGILLSAFGWWLVGDIALYAGIAMVVIGAILGIIGFGPLRSKKTAGTA